MQGHSPSTVHSSQRLSGSPDNAAINVLIWHSPPVSDWLFTAALRVRGTVEPAWEALVVTRDADGKTGMSRWLRGDPDDNPVTVMGREDAEEAGS